MRDLRAKGIDLRGKPEDEGLGITVMLDLPGGVAAVNVNGGLRRQIHVELSREKITALNLSVDRVVQMLRQENQNVPLGEVSQGDATYLVRSQGEFTSLDDIRNLVVMTRDGVPIYLQIVNQIKYLVSSGRLAAGEELPDLRLELADPVPPGLHPEPDAG